MLHNSCKWGCMRINIIHKIIINIWVSIKMYNNARFGMVSTKRLYDSVCYRMVSAQNHWGQIRFKYLRHDWINFLEYSTCRLIDWYHLAEVFQFCFYINTQLTVGVICIAFE